MADEKTTILPAFNAIAQYITSNTGDCIGDFERIQLQGDYAAAEAIVSGQFPVNSAADVKSLAVVRGMLSSAQEPVGCIVRDTKEKNRTKPEYLESVESLAAIQAAIAAIDENMKPERVPAALRHAGGRP